MADGKLDRAALSGELFQKGFNCAQSVLGAWADEIGIDFDTAMKISCGFGGGIGRMREVCGAFSGAVMAIGMKYGNINSTDINSKSENYALVNEFAKKFKEMNNFESIICREMLLAGVVAGSPLPVENSEEYFKSCPCISLIVKTSALLGEFIMDKAKV